ncbi:MAG: hypothetical protein ABIN96_07030, partial [Rubrivivax sp.]
MQSHHEAADGPQAAAASDALVLFGVTGDLVHKMVFPALLALQRQGELKVPVIGVASSPSSVEQTQQRVRDSIEQHGGVDDAPALERLLSLIR